MTFKSNYSIEAEVTPHRAGGELLVAAPAASYFLPWMQMDSREMGRVIGVESWFVVRR